METVKNVNQLIICTAPDSYAAGTIADLAAGEIAIAYPNGVLVANNTYSTMATGDQYIVAARGVNSGILQISDVILCDLEDSVAYNAYSAAAAQIDYIGYNGTTGSIEVANSNVYSIRLFLHDSKTSSFQRDEIKEGFYKSDATTTEAEVAIGLQSSLIANFSREAEPLILFELVNAGTSVATSGGTIAATKGSKYVSILGTGSDAGKYDSDGSTIVAGDYIRFGHATTKTYPVYKVDSVVSGGGSSTMVVKLAVPYQGTSVAALAAASAGVIPAASVSTFGLKLTGVVRTFVVGVFNGDPYISWDTTLQDFGATVLTNSQAASKGIGTYQWVADMELECQMNNNMYRAATPVPSYKSDVSSSSTYGIFVIQYRDSMTTVLGGQADSLKTLYVAAVTAGCEDVEEVLEINVA